MRAAAVYVAIGVSVLAGVMVTGQTIATGHENMDVVTHFQTLPQTLASWPEPVKESVRQKLQNLNVDPTLSLTAEQIKKLSEEQRQKVEQVIIDSNVPLVITKTGLTPTALGAQVFKDALGPAGEAAVLAAERSVGMIGRRKPDGSYEQIGTGFVADNGRIVTNCHVIERLANKSGGLWILDSSASPSIDFGIDGLHTASETFAISAIGGYEQTLGFDVGLLIVQKTSAGGQSLPPDLTLRTVRGADTYIGDSIGAIGYPALGSFQADPNHPTDPFAKLVAAGPWTKVFSGGHTRGIDARFGFDVLLHTASTYSGQSGSPIIEINSMEVVAVHSCCTATAGPNTVFTADPLPCASVLFAPVDNESISSWAFENLAAPVVAFRRDSKVSPPRVARTSTREAP